MISPIEAVPFRLTPNMQHFITRAGIEGVVTAAATALSRSLSPPEFDLAGTLSLFIRDEVSRSISSYCIKLTSVCRSSPGKTHI